MLKPVIALFLITLLFSCTANAQGWLWGRDAKINSNGTEEGGPVCIDNSGNIYGINSVGSLLFTPALIISKYGSFYVSDSLDFSQSVVYSLDDAGNYRWATGTFGGLQLDHIGADAAGNVYISGHKTPTPGYFAGLTFPGTIYQNFIVKLNSSGLGLWAKVLPSGIQVNDIAVSHIGDIYFTGFINNSPITFGSTTIASHQLEDVIVGKYDNSGNQQWALSLSGDSTDYGTFLSVNDNGSVYITGASSSSSLIIGHDTLFNTAAAGNLFFFVTRLDTGRNMIWGKSIIPSPSGGGFSGIASNNKGDLYCSGGYINWMYSGADSLPYDTSTIGKICLFRFDSAGHLKWAHSINNDSLLGTCAIDADDCGNIWVSGSLGHLSGTISDQMYLARFDTTGNLKATLFLKSGGDDANWIKLDNQGNLYVTGDYMQNPFIFGNDTLENTASNEMLFVGKFIYELAECVLDTIPLNHTKTATENVLNSPIKLTLYPNPTTNEFTIHAETPFPPASKAEFYDLAGRLINTYPISGNNSEISTANLTPGMYQCRIYAGGNNPVTKKLVIMK